MFKFFAGASGLPDFYYDQFICDSLSISKTELDVQPYEWVIKMMDYLKIKGEYEKFKADKNKSKNKAGAPNIPKMRIRKK